MIPHLELPEHCRDRQSDLEEAVTASRCATTLYGAAPQHNTLPSDLLAHRLGDGAPSRRGAQWAVDSPRTSAAAVKKREAALHLTQTR